MRVLSVDDFIAGLVEQIRSQGYSATTVVDTRIAVQGIVRISTLDSWVDSYCKEVLQLMRIGSDLPLWEEPYEAGWHFANNEYSLMLDINITDWSKQGCMFQVTINID